MKTIVLDPGHGGEYPGAKRGGFKEKDIALKIAWSLYDILDQCPEFVTKMTRADDTIGPLYTRAKFANKIDADLFIAIHCNAHKDSQAHGYETFLHPSTKKSIGIGDSIHRAVINRVHLSDRGVKSRNYQVLRETKMAAVYLEAAFMSNEAELGFLTDPLWRTDFALGVAEGIRGYYNRR